jgi:hypothetical protein
MAQIILSGGELLGTLAANGLIPKQVVYAETHDSEIRVKVKTQWPLLKSVRVAVHFAGFENGYVVLQLATNRFIDTFDWLVDRMLQSLQLADYGGRWEYPRLYVDVNRLLQERIQGVRVEDVLYRDGCFHITTNHDGSLWPSDDAPSDENADSSCAPAL